MKKANCTAYLLAWTFVLNRIHPNFSIKSWNEQFATRAGFLRNSYDLGRCFAGCTPTSFDD